MLYAFYALAALSILQGIFSLIEGIRFRAYVLKSLQTPRGSYTPRASIIAPCKGLDIALEENLRALFGQDYPDYEIIFAVSSGDDAARPIIDRLIAEHALPAARIVIASPSDERSEKVNNLVAGVEAARADSEAFVFVDSDARTNPDWLRDLVSGLEDPQVGAATGYRWCVPERGGFCSALLSAWNGAVATTLGPHSRNFAWGGSTAILKSTFERIDLRDRWQRALSDDYALTRAVQQAGLRIKFAPRCLLPSREDARLRQLLEFTTRQVTITRVYRPNAWWAGLISHVLFALTFFGGLALILFSAIGGADTRLLTTMLATIYLLGTVKGALRLDGARAALRPERREITRMWWVYCLLWPLVSILFLYNFIKSATTRRIRWRGVVYEMRSPTETIVIRSAPV
ncbi:MAG TPA: glycosyltransferase [Blastocatellia bacterium]|nr:glycosyltransferase [Blastocatellia bacterium]